uniref:Uncharacterized protein n=1 Tax=Anguilla anguilla TaxID=7936 RepID=A0A0E9WIB5_ANGAN
MCLVWPTRLLPSGSFLDTWHYLNRRMSLQASVRCV